MRYFIQLSYDGTPFVGWQRQPNGLSVQEVVEDNLSKVMGNTVYVVGCGRTDAGVHAKQYFAHFETKTDLPENLVNKLNFMLGPSIAVQDIVPVYGSEHARFSPTKRTYKYFIHFEKDPFKEPFSYNLHTWKPDLDTLNRLAGVLVGEHDFTAFEKKGSDNKNSVCKVFNAYWEISDNGMVFTITANRFLRNMVRAITGALLSVALGKMQEKDILDHFERKVQLNVKLTVPAKGLFLWNIEY